MLWAVERMISRTCSESFEERPLVGSSKRRTSADEIMSSPILSRLRSPPESRFALALPTSEFLRSASPSSMSLLSMRRRR
ncbi:MAG: hypothetical protein RIS92_524, partial [Verrucomicrobiota bacterium]